MHVPPYKKVFSASTFVIVGLLNLAKLPRKKSRVYLYALEMGNTGTKKQLKKQIFVIVNDPL